MTPSVEACDVDRARIVRVLPDVVPALTGPEPETHHCTLCDAPCGTHPIRVLPHRLPICDDCFAQDPANYREPWWLRALKWMVR